MERAAGLWARLQVIDEALTGPLTLQRSSRVAQFLALGLAHSGDSFIWAGLTVAAWFLGDAAWKTRAVITFAGLALAEVVVIGMKMVIRRKRPPGESGMIYRKADPYSFPSGHAARAALLCLLAWHLGPVPAFVAIVAWSPVMVLSRIAIGIHYVLDVIAGVLLGCVLTAAVLAAASAIAARM
jgi:membrane-associated phospholipid phosphatase